MSKEKYTFFQPQVWKTFVKPGEVVEVRAPKSSGNAPAWDGFSRGVVSGYFDDHRAFRSAVLELERTKHHGIYFTLQVIDPRLIGRAFNRLIAADATTSNGDVIAYRWLPVDIDAVRPSGVSSSDDELQLALQKREVVADFVMREYKFPAPIKACSGNGAHLLFRLPDLPVIEGKRFVENTIKDLCQRFSDDRVTVDTVVCNPARIWRLYGTTAKKGDPVPGGEHRQARPHRLSYIDDLGDDVNG